MIDVGILICFEVYTYLDTKVNLRVNDQTEKKSDQIIHNENHIGNEWFQNETGNAAETFVQSL